jgi:hypothetical protein
MSLIISMYRYDYILKIVNVYSFCIYLMKFLLGMLLSYYYQFKNCTQVFSIIFL